MAGIGRVSGNGVYRNAVVKGRNEKDDSFAEEFGRAVIDSYEKRTAGNYTEYDRKKLREAFDKTAECMDDPEYFKDFYWHFCKNYGLW